jgi:hypothetical protein
MCFVRFGAYPNHMHIQIIVKNKTTCCEKKERKKEKDRKEKYNSKE